MIWSSQEIATLNYGTVLGNWEAEGVCIDTRKLEKGQIFAAFKGQNVDGSNFIEEAMQKGAAAFICEHLPVAFDESRTNCWLVGSVAKAVELLAKHNRKCSKAKFIGITGSVGKTSTKEALALALSSYGKTYCSGGNYNSQLGLPISLASMPRDAEYGIFEMGMDNFGEIDNLTKFVIPDVAIITKIAAVNNIETLGTLENVAKAKSEIFNSMDSSGTAILNGDTANFSILKRNAEKQAIKKIFTFGADENNNARLLEYSQLADISKVKALFFNEVIELQLQVRGQHQAMNMLAVLLAVKALHLNTQKAVNALKEFKAVAGRGKVVPVNFQGRHILLFDDAYNSSPASLEAALNVLGGYDKGDTWQRKLVILADMIGVGRSEHEKIAAHINRNGIDKVVTVGKDMKYLSNKLPNDKRYRHFANKDELLPKLSELILPQDIVLVKGSFKTKIFEVVNLLQGS